MRRENGNFDVTFYWCKFQFFRCSFRFAMKNKSNSNSKSCHSIFFPICFHWKQLTPKIEQFWFFSDLIKWTFVRYCKSERRFPCRVVREIFDLMWLWVHWIYLNSVIGLVYFTSTEWHLAIILSSGWAHFNSTFCIHSENRSHRSYAISHWYHFKGAVLKQWRIVRCFDFSFQFGNSVNTEWKDNRRI